MAKEVVSEKTIWCDVMGGINNIERNGGICPCVFPVKISSISQFSLIDSLLERLETTVANGRIINNFSYDKDISIPDGETYTVLIDVTFLAEGAKLSAVQMSDIIMKLYAKDLRKDDLIEVLEMQVKGLQEEVHKLKNG